MLIAILVVLILVLLYVLSLRGRTKHPGLAALRGHSYAHRGLHDGEKPENSLAAFQAAVDHGYGIELDVHLLKDGTLAVIHDSLLKRTTGAEGRVEDLTQEQLSDYFLDGTDQTIPAFSQVLEVCQGKIPLVVELKSVDNNYAQLTETTCRVLDNYDGVYCLESFDPRCIRWLRKNRPDVIRGQLTENFLATKSSLPWSLRFILTKQLLNFLTLPDFVAYKYADRKRLGNFLVRKLWGVQGVTWTLKTQEEYDTATKEDWLPIFEDFTP